MTIEIELVDTLKPLESAHSLHINQYCSEDASSLKSNSRRKHVCTLSHTQLLTDICRDVSVSLMFWALELPEIQLPGYLLVSVWRWRTRLNRICLYLCLSQSLSFIAAVLSFLFLLSTSTPTPSSHPHRISSCDYFQSSPSEVGQHQHLDYWKMK